MSRKTTGWLILATVLVWVGYDIAIYSIAGNAATESATIWRAAWNLPSVDWIVGILIAHLFLEYRPPSTTVDSVPIWVGYLEVIVLIFTAGWLGWDLVEYIQHDSASVVSLYIWGLLSHRPYLILAAGMCVGQLLFRMHEQTE